jgi:ornithine decarboxylase
MEESNVAGHHDKIAFSNYFEPNSKLASAFGDDGSSVSSSNGDSAPFQDDGFMNEDLPHFGMDSETSSVGSQSPSPKSYTPHNKALGFETFTRNPGANIFNISNLGSVAKFIASRIDGGHETGSFLVTNLAPVVGQYQQWVRELPMVQPFFAVKCNPDPVTVRLLASMGCGFDCATLGEMNMVLNGMGDELSFGPRGLARSSIIYSHPAKMVSHIEYALNNNIVMTVIDGEDELYKLASLPGHEDFQILLRLATDDKHSICRFSKKFGADVREAPHLLEVARSLGLNIIGVHFHVGSGCGDGNAYVTALKHARWVFDMADQLGLPPMTMVDLGGGFPGDTGGYGGPGMPTFQDLAADIRAGIEMFADGFTRPLESVRFIAEPGRYFVSAATTIVTQVYSRKGGQNPYQALYVNDGVYGSFNNVVYDHATPVPQKLCLVLQAEAACATAAPAAEDTEVAESHLMTALPATSGDAPATIPTAIFGPTCDGLDQMCTLESTQLARCEVGDWLIWENMGAYTHTASFVFNGFTHIPKRTYCIL